MKYELYDKRNYILSSKISIFYMILSYTIPIFYTIGDKNGSNTL